MTSSVRQVLSDWTRSWFLSYFSSHDSDFKTCLTCRTLLQTFHPFPHVFQINILLHENIFLFCLLRCCFQSKADRMQLGVLADLLGASELIRTKVLDFSALHIIICPTFLSIVLLRHMKAAQHQAKQVLCCWCWVGIITGAQGHPQSVHWIPLTAGSRLHDPVINQNNLNGLSHSSVSRAKWITLHGIPLLWMRQTGFWGCLSSFSQSKLVVYKMTVEQCVPENIVKL